jgi:hypothetical protein
MDRFDRQSFLGRNSSEILDRLTVGIIGLGVGGSHEVQQLAHVGVGRYVIVDPDTIDLTNTNRLIGGTLGDAELDVPKVEIAERMIRGLLPGARITPIKGPWEGALEDLKRCDVIMGAVDSFVARERLECFCRRYLIPYIDIGMDVLDLGETGKFLVSGQVILSTPGRPCLRCCGFLDDDKLKEEAKRYGDAGGRPQVVWSNGVLASVAVGLLVDLVCSWHSKSADFVHLIYDGNRGTVVPSPGMEHLQKKICPHFPANETGDPGFDVRKLISEPMSIGEESNEASSSPATSQRSWWKRMLDYFH